MAAGDSLLFDGTDDQITCAVGGTPTFGPGTIASIFKYDESGGDAALLASAWEQGIKWDGNLHLLWDGGGQEFGSVLLGSEWYLGVLTKATGTVLAREHLYRYSTSSWTHTNLGGTSPNIAPGASTFLGSAGGGSFFKGNLLITAAWNTDTADAAVEAWNLQSNRAAWDTAAPLEGWYCNTMSAISSFGTVGTADETGRTGTTLDVGDVPAGWAEDGIPVSVAWMVG